MNDFGWHFTKKNKQPPPWKQQGAFGTFRGSGNGTPCTKTAATAPRPSAWLQVSFVAGPTVSLCIYNWKVLSTALLLHTCIVRKICAKCDEIHPLCAPSSCSTCPKPPLDYFSTACWLDLEIHTLTWPRNRKHKITAQLIISWGPKVVQDPQIEIWDSHGQSTLWKRKESAMNTTLSSFWLLWCFKKQTCYDSKPVARLFSHLHAVPFPESQLWL